MYLKNKRFSTEVRLAVKVKNWKYVVFVCESILPSDISNLELWQAFTAGLVELGERGFLRKLMSFAYYFLFKRTKNIKWLVKGMSSSFKLRKIYSSLFLVVDEPVRLFLMEFLYRSQGRQMIDGVALCNEFLTLKMPEKAIRVAEEMLKEIGNYAEILTILQTAAIEQSSVLNSEDRA